MTRFGSLFGEFFKKKSKTAYIIILIQLVAAVVFTIIAAINTPQSSDFYFANMRTNAFVGYFSMFILIFLMESALADPVYLIITSYQNEKINRSQTWRLIPMSDGKIYLTNTLSSFVSYIYFEVLQIVTALIMGLILYVGSSDIRKGIAYLLKELSRKNTWAGTDWTSFWSSALGMLALSILIGLFWYIAISFYHFTTRTLIDFLPNTNSFILFIVRTVMLILIVWLVAQAIISLNTNLNHIFESDPTDLNIWIVVLEFAVYDLIFGSVNMFLMNRYVEAKQN